MTIKLWLLVLLLAVSFAFGRFSAPEKVKIETKIIEVERKTDETKTDTSRDKHKKTTVVEVTRPDGTKETTTTIEEDSTTNKTKEGKSVTERAAEEATLKEITRASSKVTVSALYGMPVTGGLPAYGASIVKPVLGPISIGAFFLTPNVLGASVGLQF